MKKLALLMVFLSGCVSTNSFKALEYKVNEMEETQKLYVVGLANALRAAKVHDSEILELAKAAVFLFKKLEKAETQGMINVAGIMQAEKDLEDLDAKVEKLGKKLDKLQGSFKSFRKKVDPKKFKQLLDEMFFLRHYVGELLNRVDKHHPKALQK